MLILALLALLVVGGGGGGGVPRGGWTGTTSPTSRVPVEMMRRWTAELRRSEELRAAGNVEESRRVASAARAELLAWARANMSATERAQLDALLARGG